MKSDHNINRNADLVADDGDANDHLLSFADLEIEKVPTITSDSENSQESSFYGLGFIINNYWAFFKSSSCTNFDIFQLIPEFLVSLQGHPLISHFLYKMSPTRHKQLVSSCEENTSSCFHRSQNVRQKELAILAFFSLYVSVCKSQI